MLVPNRTEHEKINIITVPGNYKFIWSFETIIKVLINDDDY